MNKKPVLLVEDNDDDVELTLRAFTKNNFANEVIVARDGAEAMDLLLGTNGKDKIYPAMILLDLKMPRMGGLDVLQEMQKEDDLKLIPTIILTTSNEEDDVVKSYRFGANSYIRKPVNFTDFVQAVNQLGVYWLALNHPSN